MTTITRFEEIRAWQTARELTRQVYQSTERGPLGRDYGLRDQMRRAAVSIMSNIAEGFESDSRTLFVRYLGYAKASAGELRAQLYVASDVNYLDQEQFHTLFDLVDKCSREISRFMSYLRSTKGAGRTREEDAKYRVDD